MAASGSRVTVLSALAGNTLVTIAKFIAFSFTGSASILSEAIHSTADSFNQLLLFIGIVRSGRSPDRHFEYGYGAERYVWALISAVGIFFLGCGVTIYHGVHSLIHPPETGPSENLVWAIGVLFLSLAIEGAILVLAVRSVKKAAGSKPFLPYLRNEADPSSAAVILEDAAACVGVIIALMAIGMAWLTGLAYWDAFGSILIGLLLGVVAIWLIARNRELLVGSSIPPDVRDKIRDIINANPSVERIIELRTRVLDTETYRIKADIRFDGATLAKKLDSKLRDAYPNIDGFDDFRRFAIEYADDLIDLLAKEVDTIEEEIRAQIPQARHLDLEAD